MTDEQSPENLVGHFRVKAARLTNVGILIWIGLAIASFLVSLTVNAGAKMHRLAGVKVPHG